MRESKKSEGGAFKAPPPGSYRVKVSEIEIFSWGDGLIGRVTSKELKKFPMELGFFEKLRIFQVGV